MKTAITWLGHSAFLIELPGGQRVLTDPWLGNPNCPPNLSKPEALKPIHLILLSHGHNDHAGEGAGSLNLDQFGFRCSRRCGHANRDLALLAIAQGRLWAQARGDELVAAGVPWDMASMMDAGDGDGRASVALVAQPAQTPAQAAAKATEQARSDARRA